MSNQIELKQLRKSENRLYDLHDFKPKIVDEVYFKDLNVKVKPTMEILQELKNGSSVFIKKFKDKSLLPESSCQLKDISLNEPLKSHRYTSKCPIDILEIDPMVGCNANCLYCLVTDGEHAASKIVYKNYSQFLKRKLEDGNGTDHYYYFAPKTEPFQEATLQTGVAHGILKEFITYFKHNPRSKSKLFIISKAGKEELKYKHNGDTIIDLLRELSGKVTFDTSISVLLPELYPILEPRVASNEARLEASLMCQEFKIPANEALVQPIMPVYFTDEVMIDMLKKLKKANIKNFKPEFLTLSTQNLAWIGELVGHIDKKMSKEIFELYIAPENVTNIKHRNRMAPHREYARDAMLRLKKHADEFGLTMTLCHWVRDELNITPLEIPHVSRDNWSGLSLVCKPV
jgi:DNA repair photolyase